MGKSPVESFPTGDTGLSLGHLESSATCGGGFLTPLLFSSLCQAEKSRRTIAPVLISHWRRRWSRWGSHL